MSDKKRLTKATGTGMICGMLTSVILMCIFALVMTQGGLLPVAVINYLTAAFLTAGAFVGGWIAARLNRGAGLIAGALTGAGMLAVLVLTAALKGNADFTSLTLIKLAAALLGGAAGGALGVGRR